jgi:hypothetical protein
MIFYFKDGKWTAISSTNAKYWETNGFGNCKKLELALPQMGSFGWEKTERGGYRRKEFTQEQFWEYLVHYRKICEVMMLRIDVTMDEMRKCQSKQSE